MGSGSLFQHGLSLKRGFWVDHPGMILPMNDAKLTTLDQVRVFLAGTAEVAFTPAAEDAARYATSRGCCGAFVMHR